MVNLKEMPNQMLHKHKCIETSYYIDGKCDLHHVVIVLLAKLLCKLCHRSAFSKGKPKTVPLIVTMLTNLANPITTPEAHKRFAKHHLHMHWLPIMLVDQVHTIFCQFTKVTKSTILVWAAKEADPIISNGTYKKCFVTFEQVVQYRYYQLKPWGLP